MIKSIMPGARLTMTNKSRNFALKNKSKMGQLINIADIKALYPDEWVLLGNPIMDDKWGRKDFQSFHHQNNLLPG